MRPSTILGRFILVGGFLVATALGQSILTFQSQVVANTGAAVPGIPGASYGIWTGFSTPNLADDGGCLFQARFSGGGAVFGVNDSALFFGDKGTVTPVLRWGAAEPSGSVPGATILNINPNHATSAGGNFVFGARLTGPGITFSDDSVLYAGTPGNLSLVARENAQAADSPPGTVYAVNGSNFGLSLYQLVTSPVGNVAFATTLSGGVNGLAVFSGPPGNLTRVMTVGEVLSPTLTIVNFSDYLAMNASGQVLIDQVFYQQLTINNQPIVHAGNNESVWLFTPGGGKQEILREGTATSIPGTRFAGPISAGSSDKCNFNASGQVFMVSQLDSIPPGNAVTFGVNDVVYFIASPFGHTVVARKGDPAPGIPGATLSLSTNGKLRLNDDGVVAFCSQIAGAGVTPANDTGLWMGTPGNLTLVAREGSVAPGTGGLMFGDLCGLSLLNGSGQLLFYNLMTGGPSPTFILWCYEASTGLQIVAKSGDVIEISPGNFQPVSVAMVDLPTNGDSRPGAFGHDGTLGFLAGIGTGAGGGIVKTRIGSLTGSPKAISAASGGTHSLFLDATSVHAGRAYLVAGSVSGTSPGIPVGSFLVPLNPDFYTDMMLMNANVPPFGNTAGVLNASGRSVATVTIPPGLSGIAGLVLNHAYGVVDGSANLVFVSEAATLTITP